MDRSEIEWKISTGYVEYPEALSQMDLRAAQISAGEAKELVWLLEHPPLYTAGTSAVSEELIDARFPVYVAGRGGRYTYHGPGQRVGYVMLNLNKRGRDVRNYVHALEGWVISALGDLGVESWRAPGRIGIWTNSEGKEAKIGAIGVRVRRWVTLHGFSINVCPDLSHFGGIVPCGLQEFGVTSLERMGAPFGMEELDAALSARYQGFIENLA